jgi:putative endonuclease
MADEDRTRQAGAQPPPRTAPTYPPHTLGRTGEQAAADHLAERGWTILERNYRFGRREVDLVARRGNVLAFAEVKTRAGSGWGSPAEAVTRLKQREIAAVASAYLVRHRPGDVDVRFDVLSIVTDTTGRIRTIEHLEDAWRPERPP